MKIARDNFVLSDESQTFDVAAIAALVRGTYWGAQRTTEQVAESLTHSTCLALTLGGDTIGFVRAITDHAVNSYICDFIVSPSYQKQSLGTWMLETLIAHPALARTTQLLVTRDAMTFYEQQGFSEHPWVFMRRLRPLA